MKYSRNENAQEMGKHAVAHMKKNKETVIGATRRYTRIRNLAESVSSPSQRPHPR